MEPREPRLTSYWAIPLRILLGLAFLYHGLPKFSGAGHAGFTGMLHNLGFPAAAFWAWLVAFVEVLGGIALLIGFVVPIASALLVVEMLVAMFKVHLAHGFNAINVTGMTPHGPQFGMPGAELNLLFIAGLLALFIGGPGPLSVDAWLFHAHLFERMRHRPQPGAA
jgi:putative oxidoreductase